MMRSRIRHIIAYLFRTLAVCIIIPVFHGCNSEIVNPGDISDDIVQMSFRIRLGDGYGTRIPDSRAEVNSLPPDYDDTTKYETGIGYENYIGIAQKDFLFLLFDSNGKFVETMKVIAIYSVDDAKSPSDYNVLCTLTKKPDATFRIVVLANWGADSYPGDADLTAGVTTISDVCEGIGAKNTYHYDSPYTPSATTPVPMYGVKTCTMPNTTDRYIDIGDLYLLRAMAKVEVICKAGSGLELASVNLVNYNTTGYSAPQGMYDNTNYTTAPHIPEDAVDTQTSLAFQVSADKSKAVIYIPEYENTGAVPRSWLSLTFADNTDKHYTIDFREYSDGKPAGDWFDILRNCCYRFTVDKTAEFSVDLIPYGVIELEPGFGID